ncbi:transketolase [Fibrobacter succinogenes]|uniref:transketolase family protein n=1 Tax=Fibrobacter succinogenes TaxID=833 RepID=UPI001569CB93|nr:transketolase [Fibrobacter succinogenes]
MQDSLVTKAADNVRILSAAMVQKAKSGHPGGAMGAADAITLLFAEFLRYDPDNANWMARDRFFMDPGHMSPLLYSELVLTNRLTLEDVKNFRQLGSRTPGHPEVDVSLGIENSSGPLGIGHGIALGGAIAERFMVERFGSIVEHKTVCLVSDGGLEEEIAYGVGRIAGHLKLSNLIFFYDANQVQLSCKTEDVMDHDFVGQYESWGFRVIECDGSNIAELRKAFKAAWTETEKPVLVYGHTTMAKGAIAEDGKSYEGAVSTHGQPLNAAGASTSATVKNLGGNPDDPFQVFDDVKAGFEARANELRKEVAEWKKAKAAWDKANAEKSATLNEWLSGKGLKIDLSKLNIKEGVATRVTSGTVLGYLAENYHNIICSSADLSNSDNTQAFLDKTGIFRANDFKGAFVQVGVAELTMGAIANGIALHGGLYPICATFFVFSDFMKPAIRMAALMGLPVKYVFTHDSFRVGEDGPTHQPIEHETQIRLLESLTKASGKAEMLVLRPADAYETLAAWEMAFENNDSPTALILTRQVVNTLPGDNRYEAAKACRKGAYIVSDNTAAGKKPELTLVANGSDVLLEHQAAELLRAEGKAVRVVSMISPALFLKQDKAYRDSIIAPWTPVFAKSSGLPLLFAQVVGGFGKVSGLERFGASAPAGVLEKEFGYVPEAVAAAAKEYLAEFAKNVEDFKKANA